MRCGAGEGTRLMAATVAGSAWRWERGLCLQAHPPIHTSTSYMPPMPAPTIPQSFALAVLTPARRLRYGYAILVLLRYCCYALLLLVQRSPGTLPQGGAATWCRSYIHVMVNERC